MIGGIYIKFANAIFVSDFDYVIQYSLECERNGIWQYSKNKACPLSSLACKELFPLHFLW